MGDVYNRSNASIDKSFNGMHENYDFDSIRLSVKITISISISMIVTSVVYTFFCFWLPVLD